MEIAQISPTSKQGVAETQQWPRTAPLRGPAKTADKFQRVKRSVLLALSFVVCIAFPVALATAVYFLASLVWKI